MGNTLVIRERWSALFGLIGWERGVERDIITDILVTRVRFLGIPVWLSRKRVTK